MLHALAPLLLAPLLLTSLALLADGPSRAQMVHEHKAAATCADPSLACAANVTPTFAADGTLWIVARTIDRVFVATSKDRGLSFTAPVLVTPEPFALDTGPDARPKIVVDRDGRAIVAFAVRDKKFKGRVFVSRSSDKGRTFSAPVPITASEESQRFETLALDVNGEVFSAWIDKRNRVVAQATGQETGQETGRETGQATAQEKGETAKGAALVFAWSGDHGATFSEARIAQDHTCECCRIAIGFAGPGRPVVVFRNIFDGSVRDHAVVTFVDRDTPGPVLRVSADDWAIDSCPHHGPSLAVAEDGSTHVAWFTKGRARQGLFTAHSRDGGRSFSDPVSIGDPEKAPARPSLLAMAGKIYLAWKEFDGALTSIMVMTSPDDGVHWSAPRSIATTSDESDHPMLVGDGRHAFLSWQTRKDGYRVLALGDAS